MNLPLNLLRRRRAGGVYVPPISIDTPSITSPADNATDVALTPALAADAFNVSVGSDTHASSDWQVATDAGFSSIFEESLADASNLESYTVTGPLDTETEHFVRVRYRGASGAVSDWSSAVSFTTSAGYSAEALAYFAAMSVAPDATRKAALDAFISGLVSNGIWAELDWMYIIRAHDAQAARLNVKNPGTFTASVAGSPTFTTDRGYTGVPTTGYLNTGWDPATNGVNYTQNDCCFGGYLTPGVGADTVTSNSMMGEASRAHLNPRNSGNLIRAVVNAFGTSDSGATITTRAGLSVAQRTGASATELFRNGASVGTDTDASSALASVDWFLLCRNSAGTPSAGMDNQIGLAFAGGSLTSGQHAALDALWDTYVTATT